MPAAGDAKLVFPRQLLDFLRCLRVAIRVHGPNWTKTMAKRTRTTKTQGEEREAIYAMQAEICRVLGHPRRIQILDLLADGEKSTAELLQALGVNKVNLSQHLALLKRAGLIETMHQGRETSYRLSFTEIKDACRLIREVLAARLRQGTRLARSLDRVAGSQSFAG